EYLFEYTAFHSIRQCEDGWRWKFDIGLPTAAIDRDADDVLPLVPLPVDVVYGEHSLVMGRQKAERLVSLLPKGRGPIAFAEGHHHFMLENPLGLVSLLRGLLA